MTGAGGCLTHVGRFPAISGWWRIRSFVIAEGARAIVSLGPPTIEGPTPCQWNRRGQVLSPSNLHRYLLLPSDVGSLYLPVGRPAPGGFGTRGASILCLGPTGSTSVGSRAVASGSVGVISKRGPPVAPTGILGNESPISPCRGRPSHIRGTSTVAVPNSYEPRAWMRLERSWSSCSRADSR